MRRVYDAAKTPLQRLSRSGCLSAENCHHLDEVVRALDPLDLLGHLEQLQQALWRFSIQATPHGPGASATSVLPFCVHGCLQGMPPPQQKTPAPTAVLPRLALQPPGETGLLDWPRTSNDPFEGQWEQILALMLAHPEWSGNDLFEEMQRQFPGRYRPSQVSTLQQGLRKIRARLLLTMQEPWPQEVIQRCASTTVSVASDQRAPETDQQTAPVPTSFALLSAHWPQVYVVGRLVVPEPLTENVITSASPLAQQDDEPPNAEPDQALPPLDVARPQSADPSSPSARFPALTIERAIQWYVQEQRTQGRSSKTMEWHQTALSLFQQYLVGERHLCLLCQVTQAEVRGWVAFLQNTPSRNDTARSVSTIATYARSARAFCHWAVRNGHLERTPIIGGVIPKAGKKPIHVIEPDEFERLLLACRAGGEACDAAVERAAARNRSILWVFLDTGMRVGELCELRLSDVDRERRALRVRGTGGSERWLGLSSNGWYQMLSYLERYRPKTVAGEDRGVQDEYLFLSQWYRPLTSNSLTLFFDRLWKRAGISDKPVSPSVLRDTCAVRFLQTGGELDALGNVLGLRDKAALKRYAPVSTQRNKNDSQKEPAEKHLSGPLPAPHKHRRRQRKSSLVVTRNQQPPGASRTPGSVEKERATDAEEDP